MAIDNKLSLKEEHFTEEEIKKDLEIYNKDKKEEEKMFYSSYLNSLTHKRMYVTCTKEYFYK